MMVRCLPHTSFKFSNCPSGTVLLHVQYDERLEQNTKDPKEKRHFERCGEGNFRCFDIGEDETEDRDDIKWIGED